MSTSASSAPQHASTSGVDLLTLAITAVASAAAAYICSQIWKPGTLPSAALMPVLVALIKEALARPTHAVAHAVPVRGVVRSAARPDEPFQPVLERVPQQGEIAGPSRSRRGRGWRTAIVTGLLGFLVCAVIITIPELVAGKAVSGGGSGTTLFGGNQGSREPATPTDTTTTTAPAETVTVPPAETVTVPPASTTTTTVPEPATPEPATPEPSATPEPPPAPQPTTPPPAVPPG